jgi:hypothetical protein
MHSRVFQRPQIALVLRTRAFLRSLKNSLVHVISKLHSKPCYYLYKTRLVYNLSTLGEKQCKHKPGARDQPIAGYPGVKEMFSK